MAHFKKIHMLGFFPIFSVIALALAQWWEHHYTDDLFREHFWFGDYLYLNILFLVFYMFLLAYAIPLIVDIRMSKRTAFWLKVICFGALLVYILASLYSSLLGNRLDMFPQRVDISLGIVGGVVLGVAYARSNESSTKKSNR
ncbi:hypothetical protein [Bifidobacterium psychraerophilum]|uniref:hypothetical protein n=1 Tax=Bifidobacterium psychraerophilum TaxID=218140 RepID=UPI0039EB78A6